MNVETLNIFCDVVRHQSFSRGASANSVSQSAASQAVRQLEKHLNAELIDRSKRPWVLTAEGKIFFKGCREIVELYHELEDKVRSRQEPSHHTVRLTAIYSVGLHHLRQYVDQFQALVPGATVDLEYVHPNEIFERILNDQADLGLISFVTPKRELTIIPWQRQPMVVACSPTHRFAQNVLDKKEIRPTDLVHERFVAFDRDLPARREIDRFLKHHNVEVDVTAEFDNIETIKQAVEEGGGIAVLPEPTLQREVQRRTLVQVQFSLNPNEPQFVRPLSIVHRRNKRLNPAVAEFVKLLQSENGDRSTRLDPALTEANRRPPNNENQSQFYPGSQRTVPNTPGANL